MVSGSIVKTNQKKSLLYRGFTATLSTTEYLPPSQFKVGINNDTPDISGNDLTIPIPITNGTVNDDGSNQLTGSSAGNNTTDNTTTYKEGAGESDNTAQNLIKDNSDVAAQWTITSLSTNIDDSKYGGFWLYIKDSTALSKFRTSGNPFVIRIGSDVTANYYSKEFSYTTLVSGWQWVQLGIISDMTEVGTVGSPIDSFQIRIATNNATDTFVAGDLVYDLLRQWEDTDLVKDLEVGYPSINLTALSVTTRGVLTATQSNGFDIDGHGIFNEDTSPLMMSEDTTGGESKSRTDEFAFVAVDRFI